MAHDRETDTGGQGVELLSGRSEPTAALIDRLQRLVGDQAVLHRPEDLIVFEYDAYLETALPEVVVRPGSPHEIAAVVGCAIEAGRLMEATRAELAVRRARSITTRFLTWLVFRALLPHPVRLTAAGWLLRVWCTRSGSGWSRAG